MTDVAAPALQVSDWLNAPRDFSLAALRGQVVLLHAFQMLCPGCVAHGIPQAQRVHRLFGTEALAVIGLHTVFEHHEVMNAAALRVFVHEYHLAFPVGIDQPGDGDPVPLTMRAYGFRGTPSLALIDRQGRLRLQHFGQIDDLQLGAAIGRLLAEPAPPAAP